jgi:galactose mutarotase-like enzyme
VIALRNGLWAARISETGAELKSLVSLSSGQELIWNGDPAWWSGSAPVLFPVIGGLKGGQYSYEGGVYKLPSHGFARTSEFAVTASGEDFVELSLASRPSTRAVYPFDFRLKVSFRLERTGITVGYHVENSGSGRMYFSIGSHPAFVVPFAGGDNPPGGGALENYYILFDQEENLERWFFKDGIILAGKTTEVFENSRTISLSRTIFDEGVLIFKHPVSREFKLANSRNTRSITVVTEGAPYLGIWSKPGAPFVCIEPWHGIPDMSDATGNLVDKEGIMSLDERGTFSTGYRVQVD